MEHKLGRLSALLSQRPDYEWPSAEFLAIFDNSWRRNLELARSGATIRTFRRLLRISQSELADAIGTSQAYVSQLESGDYLATPQRTEEIWRAFARFAGSQAARLAETLIRLESGQLVVTQKMVIDEGETQR